jgi:phage N-6-adenine-methyltransferase
VSGDEKPDIVYGRLLEAAHISGYGFDRMTDELLWLLDGDHWRHVGPGYSNVNEFLRSIDMSAFNIADKVTLHRRIHELQPTATERAIGQATGTPKSTVHRDLAPDGATNTPEVASEQVEPSQLAPDGAANTPHVTRNSGQDEWYTPPELTHAARDVLGVIDLDPASSEAANRTVKAARFYTVDDDGLAQDWKGRVWMNPPYSTGVVDRFVFKLLDVFQSGDVPAAVVLTNNATDTRWWQALARRSAAVCMVAGRVRFRAASGEVAGAGLQGQSVCYLGDHVSTFTERFREFGVVL